MRGRLLAALLALALLPRGAAAYVAGDLKPHNHRSTNDGGVLSNVSVIGSLYADVLVSPGSWFLTSSATLNASTKVLFTGLVSSAAYRADFFLTVASAAANIDFAVNDDRRAGSHLWAGYGQRRNAATGSLYSLSADAFGMTDASANPIQTGEWVKGSIEFETVPTTAAWTAFRAGYGGSESGNDFATDTHQTGYYSGVQLSSVSFSVSAGTLNGYILLYKRFPPSKVTTFSSSTAVGTFDTLTASTATLKRANIGYLVVSSATLPADTVTATAIAAGAVGTAKLASGLSIPGGFSTTGPATTGPLTASSVTARSAGPEEGVAVKLTAAGSTFGGYAAYNDIGDSLVMRYYSSTHPTSFLGSALANRIGIFPVGAGNLGMFIGTINDVPLQLMQNSLARITIAAGGSVGIGTASPQVKLAINNTSDTTYAENTAYEGINLINDSSVDNTYNTLTFSNHNYSVGSIAGISVDGSDTAAGEMAFITRAAGQAPAEAMRLDKNGRMGVGTKTPASLLHVNGQTTTGALTASSMTALSSATFNPAMVPTGEGKNMATVAIGAFTHAGQPLGDSPVLGLTNQGAAPPNYTTIGFGYNRGNPGDQFPVQVGVRNVDSSGFTKDAFIVATRDTTGPTDRPVERFSVGTDGAVSMSASLSASNSSGTFNALYQATALSCTLGVTTDAAGKLDGCVASDSRLKTSIAALPSGSSIIDKLRPVSYKWKAETKRDKQTHAGFIAQDVQKLLPAAVVAAGRDRLGVDPNALLAVAIKELQELRKRVAALEAKK